MNTEAEVQAKPAASAAAPGPRETTAQAAATSSGIQYAKAPSMLWFILPMAALLAYGFLSR